MCGWLIFLTRRAFCAPFLLRHDQAMMFMAGANSIFTGDRLLTTSNPEVDADKVSPRTRGLEIPFIVA